MKGYTQVGPIKYTIHNAQRLTQMQLMRFGVPGHRLCLKAESDARSQLIES